MHDLSNFFPIGFDSKTGKYVYDSLDKYLDDSLNKAYFIKNDKGILGFMLIDKEEDNNILQEIFALFPFSRKILDKKNK